MDEQELAGILGEGQTDDQGSATASAFSAAKKHSTENSSNALYMAKKAAKQLEMERYPGDMSHLTKPQVNAVAGNVLGSIENDRYVQQPSLQDFVRIGADNVSNTRKILDENDQEVDFDPKQWQDFGSSLGYNDILYVKPIEGTENETRHLLMNAPSPNGNNIPADGLASFLEKFDSGQKYEFLVPAVDPKTGLPTLRKVSGTYDEVIQRGYNPLNKYGVSDQEDNAVVSLYKGFTGTLSETDDLAITASKYVQDAVVLPIEYYSGDEIKTGLDEVWENTVKDTERTKFLPSVEADEFGSVDWFMNGTGSAFGSLVQFGGFGRGVRFGVAGLDAIGMAAGKQALKQTVYNRVASWGASGIMGFGSAYNEALQNGLPDGEAFLYGTLVGGLNSSIELALGSKFDAFLTGGGMRQVSRDVLREMKGEVTEQSTRKFLKEKAADYVSGISSRFSNMGSEGAEEVLQDVVEQSTKLAYNALLADKDAETYKGKFNAREYNFMQTVGAGIFGAVAASPFNTTSRKMASYVFNGEGAKVDAAIDDLVKKGKIDQKQYETLKTQKEEISQIFNVNKNLFQGLSGEFSNALKMEAYQLIATKNTLKNQIDNEVQGLKDNPEKGDQAKERVEQLRAQMVDLDSQISKFGDEKYLQSRVAEYKDSKVKAEEAKDNIFAKIASMANYNIDQSPEDSKKRIGKLLGKDFSIDRVARTADEAQHVLDAMPGLDVSIPTVLQRDIRDLKLHLSPKLNTMENRQKLIELGIAEEELPLTPEERAELAEMERSVNHENLEDLKKVYRDKYSRRALYLGVGSSRVDLQACKLEYSIVSPK